VTNGDTACQAKKARQCIGFDLLVGADPAKGGPLKIATVRSEQASRPEAVAQSLDRAILCARVAEDNKGKDIGVLDMRGITPLYDFFVIVTGISRRQIHNLAEEIDASMRAQGETRLSIEGYEASKWVVQDYGDVVVHVFDPDTRTYYGLEDLWADAPHLDWEHH
jgi:ribosome-associated protein